MDLLLVWLHVVGNIVWIGAILAVGVTITSSAGDAKTRGELALGVYKRLAVPAFVLSFVCGMARLLSDPGFYLKQHHWMHPKLVLALAIIAIHHVIGGRAKKLARGTVQDGGRVAILTAVLALAAVGAAFLAIYKDQVIR
jgi:putative membrane protein